MPRIVIIDDVEDQIQKLSKYLIDNGISLNEIKSVHLPSDTLTGVMQVSVEDQKFLLIKKLEELWNESKVFLIDMALLGDNFERPLLSQRGIKEFLDKNDERVKALVNREKYIFIITAHGIRTDFLELYEEPMSYIHVINKPGEGAPVKQMALCDNHNICPSYKEKHKWCQRNDCLYKIINKIISES